MARDFDFHINQRGSGAGLVCVHETGTDSEVWEALADAASAGASTLTYDRRGWGETGEPLGYARTTVAEHSDDLDWLIAEHEGSWGGEPMMICGAGFGAVVALDMALRRPQRCRGLILIEPPILATLPDATELISADLATIEALAMEGVGGIVDAYFGGMLPGLGAGGERIPDHCREQAAIRPGSLIAELGAVPQWPIPLREMRGNQVPAAIVTSGSTPDLLRRAADQLSPRLNASERHEIEAQGLPHTGGAEELAALIAEFA